ncbi:MAG: glycosyltransferase [Undibacterium sp.]|uniref:glycosyltransferase family 2 protein n=1 Tax=Undibacterium sp. TaxID=1914977 RepID=UPI002719789F|nr:glycosyltransferase family 2 protein [Undibacterium sp.]MDO8652908.1 glycosyltransferase [Undibacterium sp.]
MREAKLDVRSTAITVVIATLGGPTLQATIDALNRGTIAPAEILICIPEKEAAHVQISAAANTKIVVTPCRGQVAQRVIGFQQAKNEFVVQMDDDMFPATDCLEMLLIAIFSQNNIAVAPALVNCRTEQSVYLTARNVGFFNWIYYFIMNGRAGYKEGAILKSGVPIGLIPNPDVKGMVEVEWLAGGCVMHRRSNLVLKNYFHFPGKAYCEDMIHSHLLRQSGVRLFIETRSACGLYLVSAFDDEVRQFFRHTKAEMAVRRYFMKLSDRGTARMYVFYAALVLRYMFKYLTKKSGMQVEH